MLPHAPAPETMVPEMLVALRVLREGRPYTLHVDAGGLATVTPCPCHAERHCPNLVRAATVADECERLADYGVAPALARRGLRHLPGPCDCERAVAVRARLTAWLPKEERDDAV